MSLLRNLLIAHITFGRIHLSPKLLRFNNNGGTKTLEIKTVDSWALSINGESIDKISLSNSIIECDANGGVYEIIITSTDNWIIKQ